MIIFQNNGEIDINAIKTFGVSVKKEGSIGFFGTGLKYAIAVLLREGGEITIYSGENKLEFGIESLEVTGESFDFITMNGERLGFTTELGKMWRPWMAFREIYCNCTDEGGEIFESLGHPKAVPNKTLVVCKGKAIEEIYRDINLYILQTLPMVSNEYVELRDKSTRHVFYKGVMVKDDMPQSLYTYNIMRHIDLTEDRTAKYQFEVIREINNGIVKLDDVTVIRRIVCAPEHTLEHQLDYDIHVTPSDEFLEVCKQLAETKDRTANNKAIKYALKYIDANTEPQVIELTPLEQGMYEKSVELLGIAGYNVMEFPVKFVETLGTGVFAQAKDGIMWVAKSCFEQGTKTVAHALLEEHFHLKHGYRDCERDFQTFLFKNVLTLVERLNQEAF